MIKLLKPLFLGLLTLTTLHGQILFDLQEQYFEHAYNQSSKAGFYKLPNVSVSTVNIHQSKDGKYITEYASSGTFIVKLDKVVENFSISIKAYYKSVYQGKTSSIILKSNDGTEIFIALNKDQVMIQNKAFPCVGLDKKMLHIHLKKNGNVFSASINGQLISRYVNSEFTKLKRIEQIINNVNGIASEDSIYDMVILGQ